LIKYADKVYGLRQSIGAVKDGREKPRIKTRIVVGSFLLVFLANLGSLNALEQAKAPGQWSKWLGGDLCSAKTMGRVAALMDLDDLRDLLGRYHRKRKRKKGLRRLPLWRHRYLILDGHEGVSSYKRKWKRCLERIVHFATGDRTQYYFRFVAAYLTNGKDRILLDLEEQWPGEDEIACANRLLKRIFKHNARAFDVVCGDALYLNPTLWKLVRKHKKHIIAVLKNENRDLLADARSLCDDAGYVAIDEKKTKRKCWDVEGFTTWPQCGEAVRVLRSLEKTITRQQLTKKDKIDTAEWFWATSLPKSLASTKLIVLAGHGRWHIENYAFNELCTRWHADHAYKYDTNALVACLLLLFLAYNLFDAFITRNLKPQARAGHTAKYFQELIGAEFRMAFSAHANSRGP
jgi:hypothetical protein